MSITKEAIDEVKAVRLSQDKTYQSLLREKEYFLSMIEKIDEALKNIEEN